MKPGAALVAVLAVVVALLAVATARLRDRVDRDEILLHQVCLAIGHGESSIGPVRLGQPARVHKTACAP